MTESVKSASLFADRSLEPFGMSGHDTHVVNPKMNEKIATWGNNLSPVEVGCCEPSLLYASERFHSTSSGLETVRTHL